MPLLLNRCQNSGVWVLTVLLFVSPIACQSVCNAQGESAPALQSETPVVGPVENGDIEKSTADPALSVDSRKFSFQKYTNVVYSRGDGYVLHCDIYKPDGDGPFPGVLAIHGGAWQLGSRHKMIRHGWKLASRGYVVVAIDYRLAPKYRHPAQINDCKTAVRWMRLKSEKLNLAPDRIAAFGYSAGGHLAAMLGTTDENDQLEGDVPEELAEFSSRVQCVVAGGAPCEFDWVKSRALVNWLGESRQENAELYELAAPISYVTADDPPFAFYHGGEDNVVPPSSPQKMHEKLLETGVESHYNLLEGEGHTAVFLDFSWVDGAIEFMDEKLDSNQHER